MRNAARDLAHVTTPAHIDGRVAPGFEEVRVEFERNFAERDEIGAAVAAYWRGEKVVDLWGGRRSPQGDAPWEEDTMAVVYSTTKGVTAMALAVPSARGWLDYDAPIARYWPEFEPLRIAKAELEKIRLKSEAAAKKKKDKEAALAEIQDKITKMKNRSADLKTNKEYQAHLKEIETSAKEIIGIEEQILQVMDEIETTAKDKAEREKNVTAEEERIQAFKKELDAEVSRLVLELAALKEERTKIVSELEPDIYNAYFELLQRGNGLAVVRADQEICLGCDMNIPPQLFVEMRKNADLSRTCWGDPGNAPRSRSTSTIPSGSTRPTSRRTERRTGRS